VETGALLRRLQEGESLGMPHSRPMPSIGRGCHELRIPDGEHTWRIVYSLERDAIAVVGVFPKTTRKTTAHDINACKERLRRHRETDRKAREAGS